ncbi:hypothetical protein TRIATDRAFT_302565, partial [Trichoderma atroviride IMI 206040]
MLCPKWKSCRDAMPTAATQVWHSQLQIRFAAAPCQTASKESCAAAKRSRALHSRPMALQSWLVGPRGPRGIVYYLGMALEDLYGLAVGRSRHVSLEDEKRSRDRYINYGWSPSAVQSLYLRIQLTLS